MMVKGMNNGSLFSLHMHDLTPTPTTSLNLQRTKEGSHH